MASTMGDEEFATGNRCVARPILDDGGAMIAAVGISGPSVRIDDARPAGLDKIVCSISIEPIEQAS